MFNFSAEDLMSNSLNIVLRRNVWKKFFFLSLSFFFFLIRLAIHEKPWITKENGHMQSKVLFHTAWYVVKRWERDGHNSPISLWTSHRRFCPSRSSAPARPPHLLNLSEEHPVWQWKKKKKERKKGDGALNNLTDHFALFPIQRNYLKPNKSISEAASL